MNEKRIDFLGILFWVIIVVLFGSILINLLRETPTDTQVYLAFFHWITDDSELHSPSNYELLN